jgi:hypothetical protein
MVDSELSTSLACQVKFRDLGYVPRPLPVIENVLKEID